MSIHNDSVPVVGGSSPWGTVESVEYHAPSGAYWVHTAGHGGLFVPTVLLLRISQQGRDYAAKWSHGWGPNWYEEDCAVCHAIVGLDGFSPENKRRADRQLSAMANSDGDEAASRCTRCGAVCDFGQRGDGPAEESAVTGKPYCGRECLTHPYEPLKEATK